MALPKPAHGLIINYSFLWKEEALEGREEGIKDRPCAIIAAVNKGSEGTHAYILPITHAEPKNKKYAVEIPQKVKKALGLDDQRSWIVCNEVNKFLWPGFDIRSTPAGKDAYGFLPPGLFNKAKEVFSEAAKSNELKIVNRDYKSRPIAERPATV